MSYFSNESEIEAVVNGFESCSTDKSNFRHVDHLAVAVWYLQHESPAGAIERMRNSLLRFLDHHGVSQGKYHETLTAFWVEITADTLRKLSPLDSLVEKCNRVLAELADKDLPLEFYSAELLSSDNARRSFVGPDLKEWRRNQDSD